VSGDGLPDGCSSPAEDLLGLAAMANQGPDLVAAYWQESDDARAQVWRAMKTGTSDAVILLERLAAAAPDDSALGALGAGPFEDLVNWHGLPLMDELDAALEREPRLRTAVRYVRVGVEQLESDVSFRKFYSGHG
jgi:hypothetical protein